LEALRLKCLLSVSVLPVEKAAPTLTLPEKEDAIAEIGSRDIQQIKEAVKFFILNLFS
jgi:hypothetical protein